MHRFLWYVVILFPLFILGIDPTIISAVITISEVILSGGCHLININSAQNQQQMADRAYAESVRRRNQYQSDLRHADTMRRYHQF